MSEKHDRALEARREFILERLESGKPFTRRELLDYVFDKAGTTRIAPAYDTSDWIEDMIELRYLREIAPGVYEVKPVRF